jgi:hypothetical protein
MLRFLNLWSLRFSHKYFRVQSYPGFTIKPFRSTAEHFSAYGLLLKEAGNAWMLLYKEDNEKPSLLRDIKTPLKLVFYVFYNDSFFLNYSDIELDDLNQCFLLTNSYPPVDGVASLHSGSQVSEAEKVIQASSYKDLDIHLGGDDREVTVTKPGSGGDTILFSGPYGDFKKQYPFNDLLPEGSFSVMEKEQGIQRRFYAVGKKEKRLFSILELTFVPGALSSPATAYTATIGAKQVTWRYNIIEKSQTVFDDFNIYAGKHSLKLKPVVKTSLGNGSSAIVLEPSDPIVLCEAYDDYYEVEFNQTDVRAGRMTSKKRVGLPIPDVSRIKVSKSAEGFKAYSDMYIYL